MENKLILIVDDDTSLLLALSDKFRSEGFNVLQSRNGNEAVKVALKEHPELILLDILMPGEGGISVAKQIRENEWGRTVNIIVLSNLEPDDESMGFIKANNLKYILKSSVSLDELVQIVKQYFAH
jgi:DNA-binding response OmpR family regulator